MGKVSKKTANDLELVSKIEDAYEKSIHEIIELKGEKFILNFNNELANEDIGLLNWSLAEFEKGIATVCKLFTNRTESEALSLIRLSLLSKNSVESYLKIEYLKETNATIKSDTGTLQLKLDKIIEFTQFPESVDTTIKLIENLPSMDLSHIDSIKENIFDFFEEVDGGKIKSNVSSDVIERINDYYTEKIKNKESLNLFLLTRRFASCLNELSNYGIGFQEIFKMRELYRLFSIMKQPSVKLSNQLYTGYEPDLSQFSKRKTRDIKIIVPKD